LVLHLLIQLSEQIGLNYKLFLQYIPYQNDSHPDLQQVFIVLPHRNPPELVQH